MVASAPPGRLRWVTMRPPANRGTSRTARRRRSELSPDRPPPPPLPDGTAGLAGAEPPTCARYRVMVFLCALSFLTYFDRFCILRSQREIQRDLGIGDAGM